MRRVLACIGIAAAACLTALPAATADPTTGDELPVGRGQALISEVAPAGPAGELDEFIEIVNAGQQPLSLRGYSVQIFNSRGELVGSPIRIPRRAEVLQPLLFNPFTPAKALHTIAGRNYSGTAAPDQPLGMVTNIPRVGTVVLFNPAGRVVDAVAFGAEVRIPPVRGLAEQIGQSTRPQPEELDTWAASISRSIDEQDTNNNVMDFQLQERSPESLN